MARQSAFSLPTRSSRSAAKSARTTRSYFLALATYLPRTTSRHASLLAACRLPSDLREWLGTPSHANFNFPPSAGYGLPPAKLQPRPRLPLHD
ncbi:hypothetical protein PsYK624_134270 [Phanerochaete sordida]|uniref:Uncharacterized protein n=1 Tax=Phanerochaete sordida TaxID=48140 RepID=A0A9P3GMZ3_9APHY|nr:hypothetical protein PsYK624_134270 [Phanerochaete sordida]